MQRTTVLSVMIAVAAATAVPAAIAQVAKVNGATIPQARADALLREVTAQGRPDSPELRNMIKQELVNREVMAQEAVKLGLNKNPEVSGQLDLARQNVLVGALLNELSKRHPPSEDAMKKAHERFKDSPAANEYKARHILVKDENEAKEIITQLKGGANFAKLATDKSLDEGSKAQGGDLNWSPPARYVRPFGEALARLKKGETTEAPVQTNFGWHVIRLDDIRPLSYEAIKPQLQQLVQRENVQKAIDELRAKAKVE
ncbi:MAG: peptidylprolyl isomerase [Burkholderiales bacterium]|nr:peptidylprolyl isomerase [Burkholderiales bacterium]